MREAASVIFSAIRRRKPVILISSVVVLRARVARNLASSGRIGVEVLVGDAPGGAGTANLTQIDAQILRPAASGG